MLVKTAGKQLRLCVDYFVAMDGANCHYDYSTIQTSDYLHQVN